VGDEVYQGKVYRLETYRLHPAFPQSEGNSPDWVNDAMIYVGDDMFHEAALRGDSAQAVIEKFRAAFRDIFNEF
jgi:hypothetical protein